MIVVHAAAGHDVLGELDADEDEDRSEITSRENARCAIKGGRGGAGRALTKGIQFNPVTLPPWSRHR